MQKKRRVVVAYSGGLDTSVIVHWLTKHYRACVSAVCVDVGQGRELAGLAERARASGADRVEIIDARKEFVERYIYPCLQAGAVYEGKYYLGTSIARPIIAEKVVKVGLRQKAWALCHGATGKGNDQVRFELTFKAFAPHMKIIAPWREWKLASRSDEIAYARRYKIDIPVTKEKPYSSDKNLWHISYEGGILEDLAHAPREDMFELTVSPERAPDTSALVRIEFVRGVPVALDGTRMGGVELIQSLNKIAGAHGIGRVDLVENRLVGMKSRGVYEAPAATVLYAAYRELEHLVLDRSVFRMKQRLAIGYSELVYEGLWHTPLRQALDSFMRTCAERVTGSVTFKMYKGALTVMDRSARRSLYWQELATFEADSLYDQHDAEGFINLFGLPITISALKKGYTP